MLVTNVFFLLSMKYDVLVKQRMFYFLYMIVYSLLTFSRNKMKFLKKVNIIQNLMMVMEFMFVDFTLKFTNSFLMLN